MGAAMTDTDRMVVWLREAMDAAERDAEAAAKDGTPDWYAKDHYAVADAAGEPVVYDEGRPTPDQVRHIVRHDPAAVLRRIAADRKILEAHPITTEVINPGYGKRVADFGCATCHDWDGVTEGYGWCDTVRLLAEGYGWTEETT
jgi:cytochrome c5